MIDRLAIIGVGLIGSSLSLALKQAAAVRQVVGYGRNQKNLLRGVELGVLDDFADSIEACVSERRCNRRRGATGCDAVGFCRVEISC